MSGDRVVLHAAFLAFEEDLQLVETVKKALYREERLNADQMRDMAHKLAECLRRIRQCPYEPKKET